MPTNKMTVIAKARKARPDSANRPKTKVAGSTKKNTRMQPVLSDQEAKTARNKSDARGNPKQKAAGTTSRSSRAQKAKIKKGKPTVTIAPGLRSTRDVFINRPK